MIVAPPSKTLARSCKLLLAKASNEEQMQAIGNQSGGRVFLFLYTDDIQRDINLYSRNQILPIINAA